MSSVVAMPAAAAIMFCSAMPKLKDRPELLGELVGADGLDTSASRTTMSDGLRKFKMVSA